MSPVSRVSKPFAAGIAMLSSMLVLAGTATEVAARARGSVQASDPDGDVLSFAITAGNDDGVFAIDADSGEITVASAAALGTDGTEHVLTVAVSDGNGGEATVTVTITVLGTSIFADGFED